MPRSGVNRIPQCSQRRSGMWRRARVATFPRISGCCRDRRRARHLRKAGPPLPLWQRGPIPRYPSVSRDAPAGGYGSASSCSRRTPRPGRGAKPAASSIAIERWLDARTLARNAEYPSSRARAASCASSALPSPRPRQWSVTVDGRRDLGHVRLALNLDVADDRAPAPCGRIDGEDRLVAMVVDVDEEVELPLGQPRLGGREAEIARPAGQSPHGGGGPSRPLDWAHVDNAGQGVLRSRTVIVGSLGLRKLRASSSCCAVRARARRSFISTITSASMGAWALRARVQQLVRCRSPQVAAEGLGHGLSRLGSDPADIVPLDLGAGPAWWASSRRRPGSPASSAWTRSRPPVDACVRAQLGIYSVVGDSTKFASRNRAVDGVQRAEQCRAPRERKSSGCRACGAIVETTFRPRAE
jgi:hypothetical protein